MAIITNKSSRSSIHEKFWNALTKNSDSLALSQLWLCCIDADRLSEIGENIVENLDKYEQDSWNKEHQKIINIELLRAANWDWMKSSDIMKSTGEAYLWVQGISFLPDGIDISRTGLSKTGAVKGIVSEGRTDFSTANITFLESNISFVDGFLRPWAVLNSYRSLKDVSLRCDIEFVSLMKWDLNEPLEFRKTMLLKNAVPVNIDQEEYNYTGDKLINRQVQFAFDRYENRVYGETNYSYVVGRDIIDLADIKQREEEEKEKEEKRKSVLERARDILNKAAKTVDKVQGVADKVTGGVSQTLHAFGADKLADKVSKANIKFQNKITTPVANVIGTGQGMANSLNRMGHLINDFTGKNKINASEAAPNKGVIISGNERSESNEVAEKIRKGDTGPTTTTSKGRGSADDFAGKGRASANIISETKVVSLKGNERIESPAVVDKLSSKITSTG